MQSLSHGYDMSYEIWNLIVAAQLKNHLQVCAVDKRLQELAQLLPRLSIEPHEGIVEYQDSRCREQRHGKLELAQLAAGEGDDIFVGHAVDVKELAECFTQGCTTSVCGFLPAGIHPERSTAFDHLPSCIEKHLHGGCRWVYVVLVPALLQIVSLSGIAVGITESYAADVVACQRERRRAEIISHAFAKQWELAGDDVRESAFASTVRSDDGHLFARQYVQRHRLCHAASWVACHAFDY